MKKGTIWMALGILMIVSAFLLTGYNLMDEKRAEEGVKEILLKLEGNENFENGNTVLSESVKYDIYPQMEMPTEEIDGNDYIGILEIPALNLKLPVMSDWSYPKLKISPCRYAGSVYSEDLIIAAHNYGRHFGGLKNLAQGTEVIFTDIDKNQFKYMVTEIETLGKTDVEKMKTGDWNLTLFTCTYGGQTRVTVRCKTIL